MDLDHLRDSDHSRNGDCLKHGYHPSESDHSRDGKLKGGSCLQGRIAMCESARAFELLTQLKILRK